VKGERRFVSIILCNHVFSAAYIIMKRQILSIFLLLLLLLGVIGCSSSPTHGKAQNNPSPTAPPKPLKVISLVTSVNPSSLSSIGCGSSTTITFSTLISIARGSAGGTVNYTWNIGSSHIPGNATFGANDLTKTVTYTLKESNIQPGTAGSIIGSLSTNVNGTTLSSSQASVSGICTFSGSFKVTSIAISVSPSSLSSLLCGSDITLTYTATVTITPNTNGGAVFLKWSFAGPTSTLTFGPYAPGQTTKSVTTTFTGKINRFGSFPPYVSVSSTSPNVVTSGSVKPYGTCYK
jgi:hypothetical protein